MIPGTWRGQDGSGNDRAQLFGGLALFLFAIRQLSLTLKRLSEIRLKQLLQRAAGGPWREATTDAVLTSITSSSSATTRLIVAMGMEGEICLGPGIALMIAANIGTCTLELIAAVGSSAAARLTSLAHFAINCFEALLFFPFRWL